MNRILMSLLMMSVLMVGCAKEEEEEETISNLMTSNGSSCTAEINGFNLCFETSSMNSTLCDTMGSSYTSHTFSSSPCIATGSTGTCTTTDYIARYYLNSEAEERALCDDGTFTADAGFVSKEASRIYCEYQDKCIKLEKVSDENAEKFCNQLNGYLVESCQ